MTTTPTPTDAALERMRAATARYEAEAQARAEREARIAKRRAAEQAEAQQVATQATEKQIRYALDLQRAYATPATFGGRTYSREQLADMSRMQIRQIIDALRDERGLQGGR